MSKRVTYARLHNPYHSPGTGDLGTVFPPPNKTLTDLVMEATDSDGLLVQFKLIGRKHKLLIPSGNISGMNLVPDEAAPVEKAKK